MISSEAPQKKTVEVPGRRMAYAEMGDGDPAGVRSRDLFRPVDSRIRGNSGAQSSRELVSISSTL